MVVTTVRDAALPVFNNGFSPVLIGRNSKVPVEEGWQSKTVTETTISSWMKDHPAHGIGLRGDKTPWLDIDVKDADFVAELLDYIDENIIPRSRWLRRTGEAPKTALVFRVSETVGRINHEYVHPDDRKIKYQLETRGKGFQAVAFGIHPDTKKPFSWDSDRTPLNTAIVDVPIISSDDLDDIFDMFDAMCLRRGLVLKAKHDGTKNDTAVALINKDDAFADMSAPVAGVSIGELQQTCKNIDLSDEATWTSVAMAIHHETDGSEDGWELLDELSEKYAGYDSANNRKRWDSFDSEKRSLGGTTTYATLVFYAKEANEAVYEKMVNAIRKADTLPDLKAVVKKLAARQLETGTREALVAAVHERFRALDFKVTKKRVEEMLAYQQSISGPTVYPAWCTDYVYSQEAKAFIHRRFFSELSKDAYDASFARYLLTADDIVKRKYRVSASDYATNVAQIEIVTGSRYAPYADEGIFHDGHARYINRFRLDSMTPVPEELDDEDEAAIAVVENFFNVNFPDELERRYVLEWLAHVAKDPRQRMTYALVIQGAPGSGKSIIGEMMKAIVGESNVGSIANSEIKSEFSGWADGHLLKVVEEVSVKGHRFDIMNNLKEKITNSTLSIVRKGRDGVLIRNTASYLMFTNEIDGLFIDENDRRYLVVSQHFQTTDEIKSYLADHPDFFKNVENAFRKHPGALRKWLHDLPVSEDFNPASGRAPTNTKARAAMIDASRDAFQDELEALLEDSGKLQHTDKEIFCWAIVSGALSERLDQRDMPNRRQALAKMRELGYHRVGEPNIAAASCLVRPDPGQPSYKSLFYARNPRRWQRENGAPDQKAIRDYFADQVVEDDF